LLKEFRHEVCERIRFARCIFGCATHAGIKGNNFAQEQQRQPTLGKYGMTKISRRELPLRKTPRLLADASR